jgi:hypothetical protein
MAGGFNRSVSSRYAFHSQTSPPDRRCNDSVSTHWLCDSKSTRFGGLYTLKAEATVVATLSKAGVYQGTVSIPATGVVETFEPSPFDCNGSATIGTVQASGELDVETITTDIACGSTESEGNESAGQ